MSIDIQKAQDYLCTIIPKAVPLAGEIDAIGTYLLFNTIMVHNGFTEDATYHFNCYIAVSSPSGNKELIYDDLSEVLTNLIKAQQADQQLEVKSTKPFSSNNFIIYQLDIAITPAIETE